MTGSQDEDQQDLKELRSQCVIAKGELAVAISILNYQASNPTPNVLAIRQVRDILKGIRI